MRRRRLDWLRVVVWSAILASAALMAALLIVVAAFLGQWLNGLAFG